MPTKRPNSRRNLDIALEKLVGKANLVAKRTIVANAIVAQMLPSGSVKGGSAIKMRLGYPTGFSRINFKIASKKFRYSPYKSSKPRALKHSSRKSYR